MGYCYDRFNRLCCDHCGQATGDVRKRKCPYGWCQPTAMCKACWQGDERQKFDAYHASAGCSEAHARFTAIQDRERNLLAAGFGVRCSALGIYGHENDRTDRVEVTFRFADGRFETYAMSDSTYAAIPLIQPATIDDYKAIGLCEPIVEPNQVTKRVA